MSHPDYCYDPDNSYEDDMNYDDYNDFYEEDENEEWSDDYDDSMDGDHESGFASAGWGTDENYDSYADDIDAFHDYYGEDY